MPRRCRVCNRALTSPQWRKVGLGPVCARRLGLRLVRSVIVIPAVARVRQVEPDEFQMALFDLPQKGAA
jgi:hypothetical protein